MINRTSNVSLAPLKGRVCLVTGGARGIGKATAVLMAKQGGQVHVVDIVPAESGQIASEVNIHQLDVTDRAEFQGFITDLYNNTGRLDVLVNNAAYIRWTDVEDMTVEEAELTMRTGYDAMVYGVKAALPIMRAAGGGHIINVGSAAGTIFVKGPSAAYAAAKAAIEAYSQILRLELRGSPIQVTLVRPGTVTGTDFFRLHVPSTRMPRIADFLPTAYPDQVAAAILRGLLHKRGAVNVPSYLPLILRGYSMAPGLFQALSRIGGTARSEFAKSNPEDSKLH